MEKKHRIAIFSSASLKGRELVEMIRKNIFEPIKTTHNLTLDVISPGNENFNGNYFCHCQLADDIVIFDASVEEDTRQKLGDNYACATHAPYLNDNTLVVSRTELPLNYIPNCTNVLPAGEDYANQDGKLSRITEYSNEDIIKWISEQFCEREKKNLFPRPDELKAGFVYKPPTLEDLNEVIKLYTDESARQNQLVKNSFQNPYEHTAFISYRSFYYSNKCGDYDVFDLERLILDYHKRLNPDENWKVLFYPPGSLSQDCPTENLRWSLMQFVQDRFKDVAEVWIFETGKADERSYWDSWFTQGEFLSLMEINQGLNELMPKVIMFDPHTGYFSEKKNFPMISKANKRELSVIGAITDNKYGDRAGVINTIHQYANWKDLSIFYRLLYRIASWKNGVNVNYCRELHAYQPEFLTSRVLQCPDCAKGHQYGMADFEDDDFIRSFIRIGDTSSKYRIDNEKRGVFVVDADSFRSAVADGYFECPHCHRKIYLKPSPEQTKYLWTRKFENTATQEINYIERVDAFEIS